MHHSTISWIPHSLRKIRLGPSRCVRGSLTLPAREDSWLFQVAFKLALYGISSKYPTNGAARNLVESYTQPDTLSSPRIGSSSGVPGDDNRYLLPSGKTTMNFVRGFLCAHFFFSILRESPAGAPFIGNLFRPLDSPQQCHVTRALLLIHHPAESLRRQLRHSRRTLSLFWYSPNSKPLSESAQHRSCLPIPKQSQRTFSCHSRFVALQ